MRWCMGEIVLDKWQEEVLKYRGDLLICTGRRVGKTYVLARKAIERMISDKKPIIVVSLTEEQAMIIITMALTFAREKYPSYIGRGQHKPTLKTLTLMVQGKPVKMVSRPVGNTGDATRGFEGGVLIVDEASRMPKMFWIAAKPILLTQAGEIWMCSTPHGKQGYFWQRFDEVVNKKKEDARFKVFYKTTVQVVEERPISTGWTEEQREGAFRILEEDRKEMSEIEFGQEYLGLFLDEMRQLYPDDLVAKQMTEERPKVKTKGEYSLGIDIAGKGDDQTTLESFKKLGDELFQVENIVRTKLDVVQIYELIIREHERYNYTRIYPDNAGMGVGVFDLLMRDERTRRITKGLNNAQKSIEYRSGRKRAILKEDLHMNFLIGLEQNKIHLLKDLSIAASLKSVQVIEKEGRTKIKGDDDHIAEGLVRAAHILKDKTRKLWIF